MHRTIAALAIAVAAAAAPAEGQETEITVGGGLGLELFDEDVLTYPTADLGLTRWWASGWGLGGHGTFQIGTVLHPYSQGIYSTVFDQPPGTRFIGVSGSTRAALLVRRRWFPRGTEIDVGFGWAFLWHTDRTLLPDRRIGKVRHGTGLARLGWSQLAYEVLVGRPLTGRAGVKAGWSCGPVTKGCGFVGLVAIGR